MYCKSQGARATYASHGAAGGGRRGAQLRAGHGQLLEGRPRLLSVHLLKQSRYGLWITFLSSQDVRWCASDAQLA